jgi:acyl dehydratase
MSLNHQLAGRSFGPVGVSWSHKDAILYALGIGAGGQDALGDLELTTENSLDVSQEVFPTFALVLETEFDIPYGDFDPALLVHAEQELEISGPLHAEGAASVVTAVTGIYDKGSGALIATESTAVAEGGAEVLWRSRSSVFIRGEGGFGGERGAPGPAWERPGRPPDATGSYVTHPEQALLYRLSGDRNPLHSDPRFAARAGFERPILHGLCTYGISARLAVALLGASPWQLEAVGRRFTAPVTPGDTLRVDVWRASAGDAVFRTSGAAGTVVIDRGWIRLAEAGAVRSR